MTRSIRFLSSALIIGALSVAAAWAGAGLVPISAEDPVLPSSPVGAGHVPVGSDSDVVDDDGTALALGEGAELGADELLVGAAKVSIEPAPDASKGEVWVKDKTTCTPMTNGNPQSFGTHVADWRSPWIENSNCIYLGGFGVGPTQPVLDWDQEYGLWSRSVAFKRDGKALVLTILDGEGYFADYNKMCPAEKECGSRALAEQLGQELNVAPESFVFASTHAHSSMDFIGGWGGVPEWYMRQVAEAMRESVRRAFASLEPATLEAGDTLARDRNSERRDTYYSAEDPTLNWLRAIDREGSVVATVGAFAAHPVSFGASATKAHADWPGVFDKTVENRYGGTALMFEAGLGNMQTRGGAGMGASLANVLPPVGAGTQVENPKISVKQGFWDQPVTNVPLGSLGVGGFFDRPFNQLPAEVQLGKSSANPCRSASPVSVNVSVTAAMIGDAIITAAPGEIFANFSNTIEERSPITALAIGQANDALGYMPQSFETDYVAREGPGFAGADVFEYEDAYSIDHCFGDVALETQLSLLDQIKAGS
jgi:hypothetical protein